MRIFIVVLFVRNTQIKAIDGTDEKAQCVPENHQAWKPEFGHWIPPIWWEERTDSQMLSSDLHLYTVTWAYASPLRINICQKRKTHNPKLFLSKTLCKWHGRVALKHSSANAYSVTYLCFWCCDPNPKSLSKTSKNMFTQKPGGGGARL